MFVAIKWRAELSIRGRRPPLQGGKLQSEIRPVSEQTGSGEVQSR